MLYLSVSSSRYTPRPAVRLAIGTLARLMETVDTALAEELAGFVIGIAVVERSEKPPRAKPEEPGRIGLRRAQGFVTTDIVYHEAALGSAPSNRACLAQFVGRLERAVDKLVDWCDRKAVWANRDAFVAACSRTRDNLAEARFLRPYEFAKTEAERDTLDRHWQAAVTSDIDAPGFDAAMNLYWKARDRFWEGADYAADPSQPEGRFGQPCLVANYGANVATARPPNAQLGYDAY